MKTKMRLGLIGAGGIAQTYVQALGQSATAELVGVADVRTEAAEALAERIGCAAFGSHEALVDQTDTAADLHLHVVAGAAEGSQGNGDAIDQADVVPFAGPGQRTICRFRHLRGCFRTDWRRAQRAGLGRRQEGPVLAMGGEGAPLTADRVPPSLGHDSSG